MTWRAGAAVQAPRAGAPPSRRCIAAWRLMHAAAAPTDSRARAARCRWQDFQVFEVDTKGNVARLTSIDPPPKQVQAACCARVGLGCVSSWRRRAAARQPTLPTVSPACTALSTPPIRAGGGPSSLTRRGRDLR